MRWLATISSNAANCLFYVISSNAAWNDELMAWWAGQSRALVRSSCIFVTLKIWASIALVTASRPAICARPALTSNRSNVSLRLTYRAKTPRFGSM
jgi:hypothetical protein